MSINEKMTAIADAIRSKTEKVGTLTLDQMASEILSILPIPSGISVMTTGTYTFASNTTGQTTITHNLGVEPDFYLFVKQGTATVDASYASIFCDLYLTKLIRQSTSGSSYIRNVAIKCWAMNGGTVAGQFEKDVTKADTTTFWVNGIPASNRTYFSGNTFYWVCGKFA